MANSAWFIGAIACMWAVPAWQAFGAGQMGSALMYTGFIIAQLGMVLNALH
jgi:hypothetical protein